MPKKHIVGIRMSEEEVAILKEQVEKEHLGYVSTLVRKATFWYVDCVNKNKKEPTAKELEEKSKVYLNSAREVFKKQLSLLGLNKFRFKELSITLSNINRELIDNELMKQILSQEDLTRIISNEESERLYIRNLSK